MSLISWFRKMTDGTYAQRTGAKAVEAMTKAAAVKDDRASHVVAVLSEDGDWFEDRAASSLTDHITRAGQRTGAHAIDQMVFSRSVAKDLAAARAYVQQQTREWEERTGRTALPPGEVRPERMIGDPNRLLTPMEQAEGRALHTPLADNVDYWTRQYGAERAAELVGRLYDENGELVVKPDAALRERAAAKSISK